MAKPVPDKVIQESSYFKGKIKKSIPASDLIKFIFVNTFLDRTFLWMFIVSFGVSIIFAIVTAVFILHGGYWQAQVLKVFNYYFIIFFDLLYFVIIIRLSSHFMDRRIEDKTIYIMVSNQVSRKKFMFLMIFVSTLITTCTLVINCFSYALISELISFRFSVFILKITGFLLLYTTVYSACFIIFLVFLLSILSKNLVNIIGAFNIALNLIASLPDQFGEKSMEYKYLTITYNGRPMVESVPDWIDIINFHKAMDEGRTLYSHLTKAIWQFYYENEDGLEDNSQFASSGEERISFYENLGLIDDTQQVIALNGVTLDKSPGQYDKNQFNSGSKVDIYLSFYKRFCTMEELKQKIADASGETKAILQDFYQFTSDISKQYDNDVAMAVDKQNANAYNVDEYSLFDSTTKYDLPKNSVWTDDSDLKGKSGSWIRNYETSSDKSMLQLTDTYARDIIRSSLIGSASDIAIRNLSQDQSQLDALNEFVSNPLQIAATMLDNDIIYETSRFGAVANGTVSNNQDYMDYLKTAKMYKTIHYFNFFANNIQNFTSSIEHSFGQYWFYTNTKQSIEMSPFKNAILCYDWFKLTPNADGALGENVAKNTIPPWAFMVITAGSSFILMIIIIYMFNKRDL